MMLELTDIQVMKITDWDDGCKVALFDNNTVLCGEAPEWVKTKEEAIAAGELMDGNWSCQIHGIAGKEVSYVSYICE